MIHMLLARQAGNSRCTVGAVTARAAFDYPGFISRYSWPVPLHEIL